MYYCAQQREAYLIVSWLVLCILELLLHTPVPETTVVFLQYLS